MIEPEAEPYGEFSIEGGVTVDIFLMLDKDGRGTDTLEDAMILICGNQEDGFYEVNLETQSWKEFQYN